MSDDEPLPPVKSADEQPWSEEDLAWESEAQAVCNESEAVLELIRDMRNRGEIFAHDGSVVPYDEKQQIEIQEQLLRDRDRQWQEADDRLCAMIQAGGE